MSTAERYGFRAELSKQAVGGALMARSKARMGMSRTENNTDHIYICIIYI